MYASITRVKVKDMGRISDAARLKDLPDITTIPGFVAYWWSGKESVYCRGDF